MKLLENIRLVQWYHFQDETMPIGGSCILLGDNGSGKTTVLDAIQIALVADFSEILLNRAANEKSRRALYGYVRWKIGSEDESRPGEVRYGRRVCSSYVMLEFRDDQGKNSFTCGAGFEATETDTEVTKLFFVVPDAKVADVEVVSCLVDGQRVVRPLREVKTWQLAELLQSINAPIVVPTSNAGSDEIEAFTAILRKWRADAAQSIDTQLELSAGLEASIAAANETKIKAEQLEQRARGLRNELQTLIEVQSKLQKDLNASSSQMNRCRSEIATCERELARIVVLKGLLPKIEDIESQVRDNQALQQQSAEQVSRNRFRADQLQKQIAVITAQLRAIESQTEECSARLIQLDKVQAAVPSKGDLDRRRLELLEAKQQIALSLETIEAQAAEIHEHLSSIDLRITDVDRRLADVTITRERRNTVLLELSDVVSDPECPLCGYLWSTTEELRSHIQQKVAAVSPALQALSAERQELTSRREQLLEAIKAFDVRRSSLFRSLDEANMEMSFTEQKIDGVLQLAQLAGFSSEVFNDAALIDKARGQLTSRLSDLTRRQLNAQQGLRTAVEERSAVDTALLESQAVLGVTESALAELNAHREQINDQMTRESYASSEDLQRLQTETEARAHDTTRQLESWIRARTGLEESLSHASMNEAELRAQLDEIESQRASISSSLQRVKSTLSRLSLPPNADLNDATRLRTRLETQQQTISMVDACGEQVQQLASYLTAERELIALRTQLKQLITEHDRLESAVSRRRNWANHLDRLAEEIRKAKNQLEHVHWNDYRPTMNLLYQRISSHPVFGAIEAEIDDKNRNVQLRVGVSAHLSRNLSAEWLHLEPLIYLNEAQLNVFALSIFLANTVQQKWSRGLPIFLDDPVQTMDSFNANSFADTIRTLASDSQQIILATCDLQLYKLMLLKFSCLNACDSNEFSAVRIEGNALTGTQRVSDTPSMQ
ncbi:MAG TPA: ATP-binding protein [Candidatus Angelobacter sp.]|jgi:DNA repair exonuclease SbcCD ATPase subunit